VFTSSRFSRKIAFARRFFMNFVQSSVRRSYFEEAAHMIGSQQALRLFLTPLKGPHGDGVIRAQEAGLHFVVRADDKKPVPAQGFRHTGKIVQGPQPGAGFPEHSCRITAEDNRLIRGKPAGERLETRVFLE
jgi:hypothetical protein